MEISSRDDVGARGDDANDFGWSKISSLFYIETTSEKVLQARVKINLH